MSSLMQVLMNTLGPSAVRQVSSRINADEGATQRAISAAIPLLIGALSKKTNTPEGAQDLDRALEKDHDGSVLNNVNGSLDDPKLNEDGEAIMQHIAGDRRHAIEKGVSKASGIDTSSSSKVLNLLAPLVMGQLGKQKRTQGLGAQGIAGLLDSEHQEAKGTLGGLMDLLDTNDDGSVTDDVSNIQSKLGKLFG